jgi:hypothetical protein
MWTGKHDEANIAFRNFANAADDNVHAASLLACIQEMTSLNPGRVTDCRV